MATLNQKTAADPQTSIWVSASAGSGKTKVLIDRMLNLLLKGHDPRRILCLTFTKAAAAEMAQRLYSRLGTWAQMNLDDLTHEVGETFASRAQGLFSKVMETGFQIQTIHSFCQGLLKRFPLEAGISPQFQVIDEQAAQSALEEIVKDILLFPENAWEFLTHTLHEDYFLDVVQTYLEQRASFERFFLLSEEEQKKRQENLLHIGFSPSFQEDFSLYLTATGSIRQKLPPHLAEKAEEAYAAHQYMKKQNILKMSHGWAALMGRIHQRYGTWKATRGYLDYEDLILKSLALLKNKEKAQWVLYKLDGGIDHLLIDEAQDTNASQWEVISLLTEDFFHTPDRTLFIVGDEKQSIYSFQGADPTIFQEMHRFFESRVKPYNHPWKRVTLDLSFRSSPAILRAVDHIFSTPDMRRGVSFVPFSHEAHRQEEEGLVELWPLIPLREQPKEEPWRYAQHRQQPVLPQQEMAHVLAKKIKEWIGQWSPSKGRALEPQDIMVLVRKRSSFVQDLVSALKRLQIPVAGSDRLLLSDELAAQDLIKLGEFLLLPDDDFTFACLLKSPILNLSEEDLMNLCLERGKRSLWRTAQQREIEGVNYLQLLLKKADFLPPFELYSQVLLDKRHHFIDRFGDEVHDILNEFLDLCLTFEKENPPTLQGFIAWLKDRDLQIKRDTHLQTKNEVQILTVHGAKGLQAPIVVLPDTAQAPAPLSLSFLWIDSILIWSPPGGQDCEITQNYKTLLKDREEQESRRLLYVALTRAEDRLYIGGWQTAKSLSDQSWYAMLQRGWHPFSCLYNDPDLHGEGARIGQIDIAKTSQTPVSYNQNIPAWFNLAPLPEHKTPPLNPSALNASEGSHGSTRERGIKIHTYLETLAGIPLHEWGVALQDEALDIAETLIRFSKSSLAKEIFSSPGLSEVPITGVYQGKKVSGRMDRLIFTGDQQVWIVDFKTGTKGNYDPQLLIYKTLLEEFYSSVKCGIVWIDELEYTDINQTTPSQVAVS